MLVTRKALDEVGKFDEAFSPGYEEETEFCSRAHERGFLHILDDTTFVYHKGASSFGSSRAQLQAEHFKLHCQMHPDYPKRIDQFLGARPLERILKNIKLYSRVFAAHDGRAVLYVLGRPRGLGSDWTDTLLEAHLARFRSSRRVCVLSKGESHLDLSVHFKHSRISFRFPVSRDDLNAEATSKGFDSLFQAILGTFRIGIVHFLGESNLPGSAFEMAAAHASSLVTQAGSQGSPVLCMGSGQRPARRRPSPSSRVSSPLKIAVLPPVRNPSEYATVSDLCARVSTDADEEVTWFIFCRSLEGFSAARGGEAPGMILLLKHQDFGNQLKNLRVDAFAQIKGDQRRGVRHRIPAAASGKPMLLLAGRQGHPLLRLADQRRRSSGRSVVDAPMGADQLGTYYSRVEASYIRLLKRGADSRPLVYPTNPLQNLSDFLLEPKEGRGWWG
jgi:hypothetical protein